MRLIDASDIKSNQDYELSRPDVRARVMDIKAKRRVAIGDHLTLLFENRDTMIYQVQEMMRAERIGDPKAIRAEIDVYNELVPGEDELTATLLIEYEDPSERDEALSELVGLEEHMKMLIDGEDACRAHFDMRQFSTERISSVHYLKFELGARRADAIKNGAAISMKVDHPRLSAIARLSDVQAAALAKDLSAP